jgi:hypothetical protein
MGVARMNRNERRGKKNIYKKPTERNGSQKLHRKKDPCGGGRSSSSKKKLLHYTIKTLAIRNSKVKAKTKGAKNVQK